MFIKVTRSAAVSALASGREVAMEVTGEIIQLGAPRSKRACRRLLARHARDGWDWHIMRGEEVPPISYLIRV